MALSVKTEKTPFVDNKDELCNLIFKDLDSSENISVSCQARDTLLQALIENEHFHKRLQKKNFCVVLEHLGHHIAIPPHFPCWLLEKKGWLKETFMIELPTGEEPENPDPRPDEKFVEQDLILFYVHEKGKKGNCSTKPFLKNPPKTYSVLCIYGYLGETVRDALERDGRFEPDMLEKFSKLTYKNISVCLSNKLVKDYDKNFFEVVMKKGADPLNQCGKEKKESRASQSNEDASTASPTRRTDVLTETSSAGRSRSAPSQDIDAEEKNPCGQRKRWPIPDSTKILQILREQFRGLVQQMEGRNEAKEFPEVLKLLKIEFGKNTQCFSQIKTMKLLMEMSNSVCCIFIDGKATGTGFLLFSKYVLTNAHVVMEYQAELMSVRFNFEDDITPEFLKVEKVVLRRRSEEENLDYALLELEEGEVGLPEPLGAAYSTNPERGGICLIGHPDGGVKQMDPTSIIEFRNRDEATQDHIKKNVHYIQFLPKDELETFLDSVKKDEQLLTYDTCFFHGSSGSPVFTEDCKLVAMHTGGFHYSFGQPNSVIEYAIPMCNILHDLLLQLKESEKDVLLQFIEENKSDALFSLMKKGPHNADPSIHLKTEGFPQPAEEEMDCSTSE